MPSNGYQVTDKMENNKKNSGNVGWVLEKNNFLIILRLFYAKNT